MTQAPFKFCPACGQKLAIHMQQCGRCKALQPPLQAGFPTAAAPVTPPIVPPTMHVKTTLTKQQSKALGNKILAGCGGIVVLAAIMAIAFPPTQPHKYPCVLHRMDGYAVPAVSVHEHTEDGKPMLVPLQEGTTGTWNGGSFSLEGMTYGTVHVTSGYKAGEDVIVPTECIGNEEDQQQAERNRQEDIRVYKELNRMDTGAPSPAHPYEERPATSYPVFPNRASGSASFPTIPSASTPSFQPPASYVQPPSVTYMPAPPPNQTLTPIFHNIPPLPGATHNGQDFGPGGPAGFGSRPFGVP